MSRPITKGVVVKSPRTKLLSRELELVQIAPEVRKQAACVLEVLAGFRTPEQAAQALGTSLPTYYHLETRALRGLVWSCTPQPPGRAVSLARKLRLAEQQCASLQKQVQRYQALLRAAQRSVWLSPAPAQPKDGGKGQRKPKKPAVRAIRAVEALKRADKPVVYAADGSSSPHADDPAVGAPPAAVVAGPT